MKRVWLYLERGVIFSVLFILFLELSASTSRGDPSIEKALQSIQPQEVYALCKILTSEKFAGRLTGHEGYTAAARWAAEQFRDMGLKPIRPGAGYLQSFPSPCVVVEKAEMTLYLEDKGDHSKEEPSSEIRLEPEKDFLPLLFSASGDHLAELIFAGWGISAPELGYDDYEGLDVRSKFVLCFRGTPDSADPRYEPYDHHRHRMMTARNKGALGIIYIYPETASNPNGDWLEGFTPAMITERVADLVFKAKGVSSAELKKDLTTYKKPLSFPLPGKIRWRVQSTHFADALGYNVVGWVEGSDAQLKKEFLVIGGHLDHNGKHMGLFFPGADDNASGSAVVMEIAAAFAKLPKKPKRSVAFVLFGGEEKGLQGSTYFVDHPFEAVGKIDAMFNFDMVGAGDGAGCGYSAGFPELKPLLEQADTTIRILRQISPIRGVGVRGSDYAPFFLKGIPCVSFHSNGPHLYYHQTRDTIYRINPDIMADIARLAFLAALARAER